MTQFRMIDRSLEPQEVQIKFVRLTVPDDTSDEPEDRDEGFYPSREDFPDEAEYEAQLEAAQERKRAWQRGEWWFVGHQVRADILVPAGGRSFAMFSLTSPGLWGTESDCGEEYENEIWDEEEAQLRSFMRTMGEAFAKL